MKYLKNYLSGKGKFVMAIAIITLLLLHFSFFNSSTDMNPVSETFKHISDLNIPDASAKTGEVLMVPENFIDLARMASPAVVNIRIVKTIKNSKNMFRNYENGPSDKNDPMHDFFNRFFGQEPRKDFKQRSMGSGFIISGGGYIVTNNHVIENADKIKVTLKDDREFDARIIGRDSNTDIALIKIEADYKLPAVKMGDSGKLKVGQWVVAIGNPFGLEHTVTAGIVSAKGRVIGSGPYDDFIQTDASINPGNSGGPLLNMRGEVIGINTIIIAGGTGIGFAIPVNLAKGIIDQLKESGEVTRGWLGVMIQDIDSELAEYYKIDPGSGALIAEVVSGDPADKAGIKPNDIVLEINGSKVDSSRALIKKVADIRVGATARLLILRDGKKKMIPVKVTKRNDKKIASRKEPEPEPNREGLGIKVSDLTPKMKERFDITETSGVLVADINPESRAEESGLVIGDVIKEINRKEIKSINEYSKLIDSIKSGEEIVLLIKRKGLGFVILRFNK